MREWITNNKEWVFSGVGVAVLAGVFGLFRNRKSPPQQTQISGKNSTNIQAGRDVSVANPPKPDDR